MAWNGKVVVIAGVGSGLGSAVAQLVASSGATTVGIARTKAALDRLATRAKSSGWAFHGRPADLAKAGEAAAVVDGVVREFGTIDGVCVSAGHWVEGDSHLHLASDEEWTRGLSDNLDPLFFLTRAVLPAMLSAGRGSIVFVSATDRIRYAGTPSYCASKGAIIDLASKLAHDYRSAGVRVNAVLPGTMEHHVDLDHPPEEGGPFGLRDQSGSGAWEVARTVRYLLSEEARWITGAAIRVDGGYSTHGKEQTS